MSKKVDIKNLQIGGGNKIDIQSMFNIKTEKVQEVVSQILRLEHAGCDIIRVAIKDQQDALAIKQIKDKISIPLVADVHFDYRLAISAIENGVDKVRINPGNIGSEDKVKLVADCIKAHKIAVRVGSNSGSVEKEFLTKYGKNEISLAESALLRVRQLEKYGVEDIVISAKTSSVPLTIKTYRYLAEKTDYPLHLGVTEAGTKEMGIVKSAIGIGSLLADGIGDTIRVSLTADPVEEIYAAKKILRAVGIDKNYAEIISCPTCGRTAYDMQSLAELIYQKTISVTKPIKIAVMGCVVNGPGEAADCDIGIAGGQGKCVIFKKGVVYKTLPEQDAIQEFLKEINEIAK
ncbi:MAG: flavodoxin-dependent (E)-4-hydroxy-3-methylbut-2-enyl-diphosphate synthase [Clostridia bacterium]|nr:flavodoxin-dependent (E)-4-hydroxy-3-methylbut-2-enyl-diphosphate synthase [Clostridia bacterium]